MVHREHSIRTIKIFSLEKGISRQRPAEIHPFGAHLFQHRNDGFDLFRAHMPAFTRVGIQPADQNMRRFDTEFGLQIVMQYGDDVAQQSRRDRLCNGFQRQMGRHQRDAQFLRRQHHDHVVAVGARFKEFRVASKRHTRIVNHALMYRTGNQRGKFTAQATITGARQRIDNVVPVFGVEQAWLRRGTKSNREKR
ncbi:hypothetical protein D3C72_1474100 [compost metagenome]